jgi:hypothetical protein
MKEIQEIIANAADRCNGRLQIKLEGFRCDDIIREAIAEAQQPLVEALEKLHNATALSNAQFEIVHAALVKAKKI